ncbi:hypothetical protein AB0L53_41675 [Nonomuraea sp. NPDC052129]|uniref:hypothetical protein n=1 Tax=Nonomuraea sp. NPDC052129 TaxID=3154651 RepID=UPI0034287062
MVAVQIGDRVVRVGHGAGVAGAGGGGAERVEERLDGAGDGGLSGGPSLPGWLEGVPGKATTGMTDLPRS